MSAVVAAPDAPAIAPLHRLIPLAHIEPSKTNPRKSFDKAKLEELASSIRKHGIMQPILVRPRPGTAISEDKHEIVAGERRYRAATIAALEEVPCIVRQLNDEQTLEIQVIENVQRDDLHPLEEAMGYRDLVKLFKHTPEDIAGKVGKSASYIAQRMSLVRLAAPVQKLFLEGKLNLSVALMIARIPAVDLHQKIAKDLLSYRGVDGATVSEARDLIMRNYMLDITRAPFDAKDKLLVAAAGACGDCPKRTGNQAALFADISKGDLCIDPTCFRNKCEQHGRQLIDAAKKNGQRVIDGKEAKELRPYEHGGIRGYVDLTAQVWEDPKRRTAAQILGKDFKADLLVDPHNKGIVIAIVPDKAIAKALKDQGVKMPGSATRSPSAADKARSLNAKVESAARRRVFDALRPKIGEALQVEDWRAIAAQVWEDHGYRDVRLIADLWAPTATAAKRTDGDRLEDIKKRVAKMETPELGRFMVDVVLAGELDVSPFGSAHDDSPLFDFAKRYGVDVAKLRASAKAQLAPAPKKSEKKKPSAKKKAKALAAKKAKP